MSSQAQTKKAWERELLHRLVSCLGLRSSDWTFEEGEKPDFRVQLPVGRHIGIELTEVLLPSQGQDRSLDRRLVQRMLGVVEEILNRHGGVGVSVLGHTREVPISGDDLNLIEQGFREHLEKYGSGLAVDGGTMRISFQHKYGRVTCVIRGDAWEGIVSVGDGNAPPPSYKAPREPEALMTAMGRIVTEKVEKAANYSRDLPLWLALRNPSQRMIGVPPQLQHLVRECANGVFERVIVFNDPEGVRDPMPPYPRFLDLL